MYEEKIRLSDLSIELPFMIENHCPHCGWANNPTLIKTLHNFHSQDNLKIFVLLFRTTCCKQYFASFYIFDDIHHHVEHIFTYPNSKPEILPESIRNLSPNFVKMFNQSKSTADVGNIELACIGYRTAAEFLLKDFLIKICQEDPQKVSNMKLADVISKFQEKQISVSADVIRLFGNDKAHYIAKYDFDFPIFKKYVDYLIQGIAKETELANPPVKRKSMV
ncbi:hypothetical protein HMPREF1049_1369 [Fusobacterium necrophorum subsp. funduliforme ATCC 51357]|uniref:DUF4145 domain-containing protein n=1 Tax=Fusobacterium necrophorum TaxID=859 RepID=UPI00025E6B0A|nr:DUF4145 domain-containing protein [Fusobacterium necrophorum]EIJ70683.1 hypothetical protein HMPREF1049_1369 [Fusobacterium necrophorum subsp. funduliforme ATCC 51357]KAB0552226.1 DUF4145 domain-containing protein [Fusobacterium necrophorum subsp. funduliforme]KYM52838.1 hypothetical protein A2U06_02695 [Fusobacterium necrophorum subsp. funduliforme]KYM59784.1 hypothetical protein A2U09_04885 [Fusobacterium necrophorum subsp. funduliforme]MBR8732747.1 hypothetical protein [Fusobacterium nec